MRNRTLQFAVPEGLIGVGTRIDPTLTHADRFVGQVLGLKGRLPAVFGEIDISCYLSPAALSHTPSPITRRLRSPRDRHHGMLFQESQSKSTYCHRLPSGALEVQQQLAVLQQQQQSNGRTYVAGEETHGSDSHVRSAPARRNSIDVR